MNGLMIGTVEQLQRNDTVFVHIPASIDSPSELFQSVKQQLGLPVYFGNNWDAFSDCLRDLSWVPQRTVALIHNGRTFADDGLWKVYLDVLRECINDWREGEDHQLLAVFPEECREDVFPLTA